ncbi:DUF763 domain-containing protein [Archaeoglobus veneficus]|uniref:DUF763 domain-containing protein n=1 Tax=Archaeoglobus veneficus (strain DSM 11195 / SNP6) TaxID=693661 RepID=F2KSQ5_ARCVS|nr:DUF763 domain-containing protein [Archaeoglobus veneficus]AEA46950.1 protein of unknown function DUF763 [Archaeoglobus veneficus SNP6]
MAGSIYLPLHYGKAPPWLLGRMKKLAKPIITLIIDEFGEEEFFERLSDPIFFQSFSNVLGFDWNSSGTTTVLTGVLKSVLNTPDFDIRVAGGKGKEGLKTPEHIVKFADELGIGNKAEELIEVSRLTAKVDGVALQDGYDIYHHALIFSRKHCVVIQQGMNEHNRLARRYHWKPSDFSAVSAEEPHSGIIAVRRENAVMNLVARDSRENRETILDVVRDGTFRRDYSKLLSIVRYRESVSVPRRIDWKAIERAYNLQPERFERLLLVRGVGKGAIRALALIADIIYNAEYSTQDPAKYCFAVGGKDGVPFPVDRQSYDEVIEFMRDAIKQAELGNYEKLAALKRLQTCFYNR